MNSEDFRRDFLRTKQTLSMTEAFATSGNHHGYDIDLDRSRYSGHVDENVQKSRNLAAPHQTQLPVVLVKSESKKRHEPLHLQNWSIPPYPTPSFSPRPPQQKDNTGALKLWLLQHKKNPYPTKPEKIMLAILSKMTLTQVSTWFANARRRLKKEYPDDEQVFAEDYGYRKRVQRYASDGYFDRL